jgi:lysine 2,3-aminomutase
MTTTAPERRRTALAVVKAAPSVPARSADDDAPAPSSHLGERRPKREKWKHELSRSITTSEQLARAIDLTPAERRGAERAERAGLPLRITPHYLALIDRSDPTCPIRKQCVPTDEEEVEVAGDLADPLGEVAHEVAPHLVSRYPDRALLLATDRCALYCRFCTRSRMVGDGGGAVALDALAPAFAWLEAHPAVRDVILSGGDPLAMSTPRIVRVVERLRRIPSVEVIRLATRVPVTLPSRITAELVGALRPHHPLWVMTHFNHPRELTKASLRALVRLVDAGFPVMNQTVLLRGVNDDAATLEELFRGLVRTRVRPYYLLMADPVRGTGHLRTSLARGVELIESLQGHLSGIAIPKLIVDAPGGFGKVPVGPDWVVARGVGPNGEGVTRFRTPRGREVDYVDPPTCG